MLKCAIIGAGRIAHEHLRVFSAIETVEVVGLVGRTKKTAETLAGEFNIPVFNSLTSLWQATAPDLIVICVNTPLLSQVIADVVNYPWTILMEKPPGINLTDTLHIHELIGNHQAYVAFNRRYLGATRQVSAALKNDDAGPRFITITDHQSISEFLKIQGKERIEAYNLMYANSIHLIDYFYSFARSEISAVHPLTTFDPETTLCHIAHLTYANGDQGLYYCFWQGAGGWSVRVNTARGCYMMSPLEKASFQEAGKRSPITFPSLAEDDDFKPGFLAQARAIVAEITGETTSIDSHPFPPAVPFAEAERTVQLVHDIYAGYEGTEATIKAIGKMSTI